MSYKDVAKSDLQRVYSWMQYIDSNVNRIDFTLRQLATRIKERSGTDASLESIIITLKQVNDGTHIFKRRSSLEFGGEETKAYLYRFEISRSEAETHLEDYCNSHFKRNLSGRKISTVKSKSFTDF